MPYAIVVGVKEITIRCMPGGSWNNDYVPACQMVYCGPVPQIDNGFAVVASNVTYQVSQTIPNQKLASPD